MPWLRAYLIATCLLAAACYASSTAPRDYPVDRIEITDGDTIVVAVDLSLDVWLHSTKVRLEGIDAPELSTAEGQAAKSYLSRLVATALSRPRSSALIRTSGKRDKYGRLLGTLILREKTGDTDANQAMVRAGHAKPYDGGKR